jgi:uncharacterized repeat protein (TIGR01451 family)
MLTTQAEIDNFSVNYPGCTVVEGYLIIQQNFSGGAIANLNGLSQLTTVQSDFSLYNLKVADLNGLENLSYVGGYAFIGDNENLTNLQGLNGLKKIEKGIYIRNNAQLASLQGLDRLREIGAELTIETNPALVSLDGLDSLKSIGGDLQINHNDKLANLNGLENLTDLAQNIQITHNASLSDCAVFAVCEYLKIFPGSMSVENNAPGCNAPEEVVAQCRPVPVIEAAVKIDGAGDCLPGISDAPADGVQIRFSQGDQNTLAATNSRGLAWLQNPGNGVVSIQLPQFPDQHWEICGEPVLTIPAGASDTTRAVFLLSPLSQCPELRLDLGLPSLFRECPANSEVNVLVRNMGTIVAEGVKIAILMPPVFELLAAEPAPAIQTGDTLFVEAGAISPLATHTVKLTVKTRCDTTLMSQAFCWEAFARADNSCQANQPPASEIRLSAQCRGDTLLRFELKNVGSAPTQNPHEYLLIRNRQLLNTVSFSLAAGERITVDVPADGATYRMEATKFEDGTLTAASLEHCGGFTPGWITAFWQDQGSLAYDFDCRQAFSSIIPTYDIQKTAFPTGVGSTAVTAANQPFEYVFDFQNTGEDTVRRVRIRDVLPPALDIHTFRPGFASHSYSWKIFADNILEIVFDAIDLPPADTDEGASRGVFSFHIDQKKDLPTETLIENKAFIYFDTGPGLWAYAANTIGTLSTEITACQVGDIFLNSQVRVDNFYSNYPGCDSFEGSIFIDGQDISNLDGLRALAQIKGELSIQNCPELKDLDGLNNLVTTGTFYLSANHNMKSLQGLDKLKMVEGDLDIAFNDALETIGSFNRLNVVAGNLSIRSNGMLRDLAGFSSLESIGQILNISANRSLVQLNGLGQLTEADSIYLVGNAKLSQLNGFHRLKTVGKSFRIQDNHALTSLSELDSLQAVGRSFIIASNTSLTDLGLLRSLATVGGDFSIRLNPALIHIDGVEKLETIGKTFEIGFNNALVDINGFDHLSFVGKDFNIYENAMLTSIGDFENLVDVGGLFEIRAHYTLAKIDGFGQLAGVGGGMRLRQNYAATTLGGFENLAKITGELWIQENSALKSLHGFGQLNIVTGDLQIQRNYVLKNLGGFSNLSSINGHLALDENYALDSLTAFTSLDSIAGKFSLTYDPVLPTLGNFKKLSFIGWNLYIDHCQTLKNLNGLESLKNIQSGIRIESNGLLENLSGLNNLLQTSGIELYDNPQLRHLNDLQNLTIVTNNISIRNNPLLSDCAVFIVCSNLQTRPGDVLIVNNAPGCNAQQEVLEHCSGIQVQAIVMIDGDGDCLADETGVPVQNVPVRLGDDNALILRPTDAGGVAGFGYHQRFLSQLELLQFPTTNWTVCPPITQVQTVDGPDTLRTVFLLRPVSSCPELTVSLGLPATFRGCFGESYLQVSTQNTGAVTAEGVLTALVMPPVFELLGSVPALSGQNGDTLFFEQGALKPFETARLDLTVRTRCDTFLFGQTLCWEALAYMENACASELPARSEIKLSAQCINDVTVRFTLENIGQAATQGPHEYRIIRNAELFKTGNFALAAQESTTVDVPADGATYRMEAAKWDDGVFTATAIENCGGLTPGQINGFWLEQGPPAYDFACREVIGAFDPNQKTAVPSDGGPYLEANRSLEYTIDFQNTGTDTAFRVLLRDVLSPQLNINAFRPGASSHPYSWEIRADTLEVLFFPIMLPDSNINEPASHGFFRFAIDQKPDLNDGAILENTASIIFDFNPPITTNTVRHVIGQLMIVQVNEPPSAPALWKVLGNPTRDMALFQTTASLPGVKRFELYDTSGRRVRAAQFEGQQFEFQRDWLSPGLYFFRIIDGRRRIFSGKIVLAE